MIDTKKRYLKQYLLIKARITRFEMLEHIEPKMKIEYEKQIRLSEKLRQEIEEKINDMDDGLLCELLFQKYILGTTLEQIAIILNYSKRHIERLHIKALENFKI